MHIFQVFEIVALQPASKSVFNLLKAKAALPAAAYSFFWLSSQGEFVIASKATYFIAQFQMKTCYQLIIVGSRNKKYHKIM